MRGFTVIAIGLSIGQFSSCTQSKKTQSSTDRPSIYDAWDARYVYRMQDRKMVPLHRGREVGRSWSRDEQGKINHTSYSGSGDELNEDLFFAYSARLDRIRDRKWEDAKQKRVEEVQAQVELREADSNAPLIEVEFEDEDEGFIPPPAFLPQGIDLGGATEEADESEAALPFAPLP